MPKTDLKLPIPEYQIEPPAAVRPKVKLVKKAYIAPKNASRFSWYHKVVLLFILAFGLFFCDTCYPGGEDILTVSPQSHSLGKFWEKSKTAQLRTLAMLFEMYPDYEFYFLERDARLLGQTGLVMSQIENDEHLKKKIHFLTISRKNLHDPLLLDYLIQEGISEEALSQGKKILFVDTGFVGSIPRTIMKQFPKFESQFGVQMVVAAPDDREWRSPFASSRVFGTAFSETYPRQDILEGALDVVHPYAKLPKSDLRSDKFKRNSNGMIEPVASPDSRDENDGEINPTKTRMYEEDLQFYLRESSSRLLTDKLRREWRTAHQLWAQGKKKELIDELSRWINVKEAHGLAMALDFMEMTHTNLVGEFTITPIDLGLKPQELNQNEKRLAQKNLPLWQPNRCKNLIRHLTAPSPSANFFPE